MKVPTSLSQFYVKSYFAASVPDAIDQAMRELGPDALLLNSREAPPEARHLGAFEVVFGRGPEPSHAAPANAPANTPAAAEARRVEDLHCRVREVEARVNAALPAPAVEDIGVARTLTEAGVECGLARDIEDAVRHRMGRPTIFDITRQRGPEREPQSLTSAVTEELNARFDVQPSIGRITALVGPPGSGKTSTIVKLAVSQGLSLGRAVRLITTDTLRIGAAEQLRTFANILGVPFEAVESVAALDQAIAAAPANALVLIDTPGFSATLQSELGSELATYLARRQDIDTQLVLTASMESAVLRRTVQRFEAFGPAKLLFTRMDETTSTAAVFCEAATSGKPLSFLCAGQSVPEDIQPATREAVIESLVCQLPKDLRAVA